MAYYVSYQHSESSAKGQSERVPLSVINGNQRPSRCNKELLENNQLPPTFEVAEERFNPILPFTIFSDNDENASNGEKKNEVVDAAPPVLKTYDFEQENDKLFQTPEIEHRRQYECKAKEEETDYLSFKFPYKEDTFSYLRKIEHKYRPNPHSIQMQPEITPTMRAILVDWLVEVGMQFEFSSESVHLAVSLTDRFLSGTSVSKNKLQLVGITALFISAKYEEVLVQELTNFSWITDNTYSKKQILRMEQLIMHKVKFYVGSPTALSFAHLAYSMARTTQKVLYLAQYLCELSLLDTEPFLYFLPSQVGVAAYCLARYIMEHAMWVDELKATGYTLENLKPVIEQLFNKIRNISTETLQSIVHKYSHPDFLRVAEIEPLEVLIMCG